jgi:antitoxin component YwqK of YwqJK toxin-antitoxin module
VDHHQQLFCWLAVCLGMKHLATLFLILFAGIHLAVAQGDPSAYDNGQPKFEGEMQNGKKAGEWKYFHDNGQVMRQGLYQSGEPTGVWKEFYRSGQMKSEGKFVIVGGNATKSGLWTTYHKNGAKEFEGKYANGKPVGIWFEYNTLGIEINKVNH